MKQEGSSQARYFVSRLIPAHKDPPYEQVNNTSTSFFIAILKCVGCLIDFIFCCVVQNKRYFKMALITYRMTYFCRKQDSCNLRHWHQNSGRSWKAVLFTSMILVSANGCEVWRSYHLNQADDRCGLGDLLVWFIGWPEKVLGGCIFLLVACLFFIEWCEAVFVCMCCGIQ